MSQLLQILILLLITTSILCGQSEIKSRNSLTGNYIIEFIPDKNDNQFFTDPIDDTTNFKRIIDNIYKSNNNKIYILNLRFNPLNKDTLVYVEYFKDVTTFLNLKTYSHIEDGYFTNNGKVYMWWGNSDGDYPIEVINADPKTFVPFDSVAGGVDKQYVFYGGAPDDFKIIQGANPKTVKVLNPARGCWNCGDCYFVDDNNVYFGLIKIAGADPKTFKLINQETVDAADKNGKYFEGHIIK